MAKAVEGGKSGKGDRGKREEHSQQVTTISYCYISCAIFRNKDRSSYLLIDVECGIFGEKGEKSHGKKIMEFETGSSRRGEVLCGGESARTSGLKRKEVLFWESAMTLDRHPVASPVTGVGL